MSEENKSAVFIGARALSKEEATRLLPNYGTISTKIDEFRAVVKKNSENKPKGKREYTNTISILGARGTGKTSIMHTIENDLSENDIVLGMIKPDYIVSSGTITSNIIGQLKTTMDRVIREIKKESENTNNYNPDYFKNCIYRENNKLTEKFDRMYEHFCYTEDEYKKILTQKYTNFSSYRDNTSKILNADEKFQELLCDFVETLLKENKQLKSKEKDVEPLLIIFIDDIDLRTTKVEEVINALQSYSSCDRIVTIISGDYGTFSDSLRLSLINKDSLPTGFQMYNEAGEKSYFEKKSVLSHEFIKKFMPSAFRYEINKWDLVGRANYSFSVKNNENNNVDLILMDMLYALVKKCGGEENIFYYVNEENKNVALPHFYNIFDDTARGLVNVFYSLYYAVNLEFDNEQTKFMAIKSLIDTIINSNTRLLTKKEEIYNNFIIWGNGEESTTLEFVNLGVEILKHQNDMIVFPNKVANNEFVSLDESRKNLQNYIDIYHIMFFTNCCLSKVNKAETNYQLPISENKIRVIKLKDVIQQIIVIPYFLTIGSQKQNAFIKLNNDMYDYLFEYSYSFGLNMHHVFNSSNLEKNYFEKELRTTNDENEYFYGVYKSINNYSRAIKKEQLDILKDLHLNAGEHLTICLNNIYSIASAPRLFDEGDIWLNTIFPTSDAIDKTSIQYMFFIKVLEKLDFLNLLIGLDVNKKQYLEFGSKLEEPDFDGTELSRVLIRMYRAMDNIIKLENLLESDKYSHKLHMMIEESITKDTNFISKFMSKLVQFSNAEEKPKIIFNEKLSTAELYFASGYSGKSETIYKRAKDKAKKAFRGDGTRQLAYEEYKNICNEVEALRGNWLVWYGREQAGEFLEHLKDYKNIELDIDSKPLMKLTIESKYFEYFVKMYLIYKKRKNTDLERYYKIFKAKEEFAPLMKKAFNESVSLITTMAEENGLEEYADEDNV